MRFLQELLMIVYVLEHVDRDDRIGLEVPVELAEVSLSRVDSGIVSEPRFEMRICIRRRLDCSEVFYLGTAQQKFRESADARACLDDFRAEVGLELAKDPRVVISGLSQRIELIARVLETGHSTAKPAGQLVRAEQFRSSPDVRINAILANAFARRT